MRKDVVSIGSVCGLLAPIIWLIFYLIAWSQSPWYDFGRHYLSNLGVRDGGWAFNTGAVVAGTLAIPFAVAAWKTLRPGWFPLLGGVFCAAGGIALAGVGMVNQNIDGHYEFSAAFFILALLYESTLGAALIWNKKTRYVGIAVTILLMVTLTAGAFIGINALSETMAVMEILVWTFVVALQVLVISMKAGKPEEEAES